MAIERLQDEAEIVWLIDVSQVPYVREENWSATRRNQQPPKSSKECQIVGYSTVKDTVKRSRGQNYSRRLFTLRDYDRANDPDGVYQFGYPGEAINPLTVEPGMPGRKP